MLPGRYGIGVSAVMQFVLILGIVNLFADVTYEGGGSINGPFLGLLGASASVIALTVGVGEFLGYALRSVAGFVADRTGKYWRITFLGYAINLLAVPAMALADSWQMAAALIIAERMGRAIRKPTIEAMLSKAAGGHRTGWVFAVNTALDEIGATIGPLAAALVLYLKGSYQAAYALFLLSSLLALGALGAARLRYPGSSRPGHSEGTARRHFPKSYWLFMAAGACFAAGLMSYELIAYYLAGTGSFSRPMVPVLLAAATAFGVAANLVLGRLYDRLGTRTVLYAAGLSALFAPLLFSGWQIAVLLALPLLGIGYAVQDTLLKAVVADLLPEHRRGFAFGLFYTGYGCGWLVGSTLTGLIYETATGYAAAFVCLAQLGSLPLFFLAHRARHPQKRA